MPVLLTWSLAILFLLTLLLVFIEFEEETRNEGRTKGLYKFLIFFNLFIISPVVVWTAMVVFPLGMPNEKPNPLGYHMGWLRVGGMGRMNWQFEWTRTNIYSKLKCDRAFWEHTFYFVRIKLYYFIELVASYLSTCDHEPFYSSTCSR